MPPDAIVSHSALNTHRGMSGWRMMLCADPDELLLAVSRDSLEHPVTGLDDPLGVGGGEEQLLDVELALVRDWIHVPVYRSGRPEIDPDNGRTHAVTRPDAS